mmetsp:Transcript_14569/g.28194  ORF Transcript_14569/g.28194 Transcript_14569/m.28194 type:complete len:164 (-) Transcript_14569:51-542(-)
MSSFLLSNLLLRLRWLACLLLVLAFGVLLLLWGFEFRVWSSPRASICSQPRQGLQPFLVFTYCQAFALSSTQSARPRDLQDKILHLRVCAFIQERSFLCLSAPEPLRSIVILRDHASETHNRTEQNGTEQSDPPFFCYARREHLSLSDSLANGTGCAPDSSRC